MQRFARTAVFLVSVLCVATLADEKLVVLDDVPRTLSLFEVAADGSRLYFGSGSNYYAFDAAGKLADKFGLSGGAARELVPLPNGWFMAFNSHASGHIALFRPDGTPVKTLVGRGGDEKHLRGDMTGWTSPTGGAVDFERKLIFALDTSMAQRGIPDPWWSRIAVFDFDGSYVRDMRRHDHEAKDQDESLRTWYDDIEVDPARQRVYVTARTSRELLALSYEGKPVGNAPGQVGIAVFPDGRVAVGAKDGRGIQVYDAELKPVRVLPLQGLQDLEADASGRLYASVNDPSVTFVRWSADLEQSETFGPRYVRIQVEFPSTAATAGAPLAIKVKAEGRPEPARPDVWQVMVRPSDGSDLRWQPLAAAYDKGVLKLTPSEILRGFYEVAVKFGEGPLALADRAQDLCVQKTFAFLPKDAKRSVAVVTATGRRAFRQGEPVAFHVIRRDNRGGTAQVKLELLYGGVLGSATVAVADNLAYEIPAALTRALVPGPYLLRPSADGHECYPLAIHIVPAQPDSPMQRIMYHEFDNEAVTMRQLQLADTAEEMSFIRDYAEAAARLGFSRETDRLVGKLNAQTGPAAWRRDTSPVPLDALGYAPPEYYAIPSGNAQWEAEYYLDQATRYGLRYDSQLLGHCSGVRFRDSWLHELVPILQRAAQWFGRYPSFYGFNYNDEMFFGQWVTDWTQEDKDWLKAAHEGELKGRPMADVYMKALRVMYGAFNDGVRLADPRAKTTATPMWQFPAVEGSYPPAIYEGMSESYSHYLSEGYHYPWYPAHSVDVLRRPGKPLMGVFDNSYSGEGGDCYLQDLMQVLGRGVQGVGAQHTRPFHDARGASAYRLGNLVARMYGPIFADCPPLNDAAVLYSYTQDVTEGRNSMGTPHWERVFALHTAGLMAGVPMFITFEEDIVAGWLLESGKPRIGMLFLVGQTKPLPGNVAEAIAKFAAAGGKVFTCAESADFPGATKLGFKTHELKSLWHEGYAADTIYPLFQPVQEKLAAELRAAVGPLRRFPVDTDTPWVSKNQFDGGAIRYILLATDEGAPYPWDAGTVWSLGAVWRFSVLPKMATVTFPYTGGVIYDVLGQAVAKPKVRAGTARLPVDLRTFPGRLYAIAPAPLAAPWVTAATRRGGLAYQVRAADRGGRLLPARIPIRIRLLSGDEPLIELFRCTNADGEFRDTMPWPVVGGAWTLEVTELLGGQAAAIAATNPNWSGEAFAKRPDVEAFREEQIRALIALAKGKITLLPTGAGTLTEAQRALLAAAFRRLDVTLTAADAIPKEPTPGIYLALGALPSQSSMGEMLWQGWNRGLFEQALSANVPGPGRGLFAPLVAPRGYGEHCIALVGGDPEGLAKTVEAFAGWLIPTASRPRKTPASGLAMFDRVGRYLGRVDLPRIGDLAGARLDGVSVAADGRHLVVTAKGYLKNVALVQDRGKKAPRVRRAVRVGQAPTVGSTAIGPEGEWFAASSRVAARFGEAFQLVTRRGHATTFASFGDMGRTTHHFAVSSDGGTVIAPGTCGVVCWRHESYGLWPFASEEWKEAWAIDYWKEWAKLDWPVADKAERIPQFHAFIPRGADYALILFGEFSNQGWVTPDNPCTAWLAAVNLATGKQRWRFDVPVFKSLLFPTLHTSPDGTRLLLQVQMGSWNKETFRFFTLADGKALGSWDSKFAPLDVAVADATGRVALVFKERLVEVRTPEGKLVHNAFWRSQPVSVVFAGDGRSLYLADDAGRLSSVGPDGVERWQAELGSVASLAVGEGESEGESERGAGHVRSHSTSADRVYAACWDGRLRCFSGDAKPLWTLDLTPALCDDDPMATVVESAEFPEGSVVAAKRPRTTLPMVPLSPLRDNLLRNGKATLKLGGTPSWMSDGKLLVAAEELTNGKTDDVASPWLHLDEVFWDATAGRQVWAEIAFKQPTDVAALTVYENPHFPGSWPTEGLVQVWDDTLKRWDTAARGVFLSGPVNTYPLELKGVTKIRYVPWNSYYRNFHTSEIEVR